MLKIETHLLHLKYLFLFVGLVVLQIICYQDTYGQTIPRAGFPYCQGFLNLPGDDPNDIQFTVAKGDKVNYGANSTVTFTPRDIKFTGNGIRLVESEDNLRGYLFVDLPFSPTYGIKTSFEYFVHTPSTNGLGDGFSFFLFDGDINQGTFEIGGVGGSLSYAPHGGNNDGKPYLPPNYNYTSGGLKGGYLGIGFDVLGNFGNYQEKKFGGFHNPDQFNFSTHDDNIKFYPDAVTIRGPVAPGDIERKNGNPPPIVDTTNPPFDSYQFVDGKIVKYDPTYTYPVTYMNDRVPNGSGDLYSNPATKTKYFLPDATMFELGSGLIPSAFNCATRPVGYRKVFIDLEPTNNPAIPYKISVFILKDQDPFPIKILDGVDYPYPIASDATLKLGFAASTGGEFYSAIDIRNVAALVSSVEEENKPAPPDLFKEICIDDSDAVEFPFCVNLADDNTFIQCVQLMDDFEPADNDFADDFFNCEQPGFCDQRCLEERKELEVRDAGGNLIGVFKADLSDEVDVDKFNEANITFERADMNFYGTITKYYKIVDNFGLESDAIPITIKINPIPKILSKGVETNPTCDGQKDGALTGVQIGNLVDDPGKYTIAFYDEFGQTVNNTLVNEVTGADGFITATFDLTGLNLGKIFVRAINPSSTSLGPVCNVNNNAPGTSCMVEDELLFDFALQQGTPVLVDPENVDICEGTDAILTPTIDPKYITGPPPGFIWYTDKDRSQTITAATTSIDGETVEVTIAVDGMLTITGLMANGASSKTYDFFVEAASQDNGNGAGNFCPYIGDVLSKAEIIVYPAINASVETTDDWCLDGSGAIKVTAAGGNGGMTFTLLDANDNQVASNTSGEFSGLAPDDYIVEITSTNPPCVTPIAATVQGPGESLTLNEIDRTEEYCDLSNGSIEFTLTGGNLPYASISVGGVDINTLSPEINGDNYVVEGLAGGDYVIEVIDEKSCSVSVTMTVPYEEPAVFGVSNDEICEGQTATVQAEIITQSTSSPVFNWFASDGAGGYTPIVTSSNFDGGTFSIDPATNSLTVSGLAASATPYTYYLEVTGTKVCDQGYLPAEIVVNSGPLMDDPVLSMVTCFEAGDGAIQAVIPSGDLADFEFSLVGDNGISIPFSANGGLFEKLIPGSYALTIRNASGCISTKDNLEIVEPTELLINTLNSEDPTCNTDNGSWQFSIEGGTPDASGNYSLQLDGVDFSSLGADLVENSSGNYTISNLSPGAHRISASDANSCLKEYSVTLSATPVPVFDTEDVVICENEQFATLIPQIIDAAGSSPVFTWSYQDTTNPGTYVDINDEDQIGGISYSVTSSGGLQIEGLKYSDTPYEYFLSVSGDLVCPAAPIPASVTVLKLPEASFEPIAVSCFNGSDGQINLISSDPSTNVTFTLEETGDTNGVGDFADLPAGTYTITVQESGAPCSNQFTVVLDQPEELKLLNASSTNPTCGNDNGKLDFDIVGGIEPYQISVNGNPIDSYNFTQTGNTFEVNNLGPNTYSITVLDANSCPLGMSDLFDLANDAGIDVTIDPMVVEYCEGQEAIITPVFKSLPPISPTMKWYKDAALTQPISSNSTPDADDLIYQINSATGELRIEGLVGGTYPYFVEITGAGICTSVSEAKVTIKEPIVSSLDVSSETCFQSADGSIAVNSTGGSGNYEYSLNSGSFVSTNVFSGLASGTYSIIVRDDLGCEELISAEVEGPASPLTINTPDLLRSSCGLENGSIENLVISGGWGNYSIEWRKGSVTGTVIPGDESKAMNLGPDLYFLLITDSRECSEVFEFEIEESSDPEYQLVQPIDACTGNPVTISPVHLAPDSTEPPVAFTEVSWYKNPGQSGLVANGPDSSNPDIIYTIDDLDWLNPSLTIEGLPAGTHDFYFYVVCTGQEIPVEISVYDTPAVALNTTPVTCFGDADGRVQITSGASLEYIYSIDGGPDMDQTALENSSFDTGSYVLSVSTPAGCAQTVNFEIEGPDAALAVSTLVSINPGCGAANGKLDFTVTGGYVPYTIDIKKDGVPHLTQTSTDQQIRIDGQRPGVYSVTVTDSQGCSVTTNSVTLVDGPTQVLVDDQEICEGDQAVLLPSIDPNVPGAVYGWFFDAAQTQPIISSINPASDGNIYEINPSNGQLTITGLTSSVSLFKLYVSASGNGICGGFVADPTVSVYTRPTATASVEDEICFGEGGTITISPSGGSGNYTFSLDGGPFVNSPVFQTSAGSHSVEVNTPEGCSIVLDNININGPSTPLSVLNIQQANPSCDLQNGQISFDVTGGYPAYTISYSLNDGADVSLSFAEGEPIVISNLGEGQYEFSVTDSEGCKIELDTVINLIEEPTVISAQDQQICSGEIATISPSMPSNIPDPQFSWFFDAQGNSPVVPGGQGSITYTVESDGTLIIEGLEVTGSPYTYYVSASGTGICNLVAKEVQVGVFEAPLLRVSNPSIVCDPTGTVDLTQFIEGFNPTVYDYNVLSPSGSSMQMDDLESVAISGDYRVSSAVKGSSCWNQPQRIRVVITNQLIEAAFQYETDLGDGTVITNGDIQILQDVQFDDLTKGNAVIWNWDFGDGNSSTAQNPVHKFQAKGSYTIKLTTIDEIGCISEFQMQVNVFDDYLVIIPNAFTPTGANNHYFKPKYRGIISMEFYIFSTWGELIYKAESLDDLGWDGTVNGTAAIPGNYVYRGIFTSVSGEVVEKAGTFILIR